uniref:CSON008931 protein n=1 Tax=Culicoides sonorensis TaxID=179676 RepID=A0A336MBI6_CULSO
MVKIKKKNKKISNSEDKGTKLTKAAIPAKENEDKINTDSEKEPDSEEERRIVADFKKRQAELLKNSKENVDFEKKTKKEKKKDKKKLKQMKPEKLDKKSAKMLRILEENPDTKLIEAKKRKPSASERKLAKQERNLKKKLRKLKKLEEKKAKEEGKLNGSSKVNKSKEESNDETTQDESESELSDVEMIGAEEEELSTGEEWDELEPPEFSDESASEYSEDEDDKIIADFWKQDKKKGKSKNNDKKDDKLKANVTDKSESQKLEELKNKLEVLENKRKAKALQRKSKPKIPKAERKKIKEEKAKKFKLKQMRRNLLKKEQKKLKQNGDAATTDDKKDLKKDIKELVKPVQNSFNPEGKLLFSKIEFPASDKKKKGLDTNPKKLLEDLNNQKKKIRELTEAGETEKAAALKKEIAWKNAFKKVEGQKTKDDPEILKKTIRKREQQKRKTKEQWKKRDEKVKTEQEKRQKKRQENLDKRKKDKKHTKLKKLAKKGKIIAGY